MRAHDSVALARRAYRRPVAADDVETLIDFYRIGRDTATRNGSNTATLNGSPYSFEAGIQTALERMLVSPEFLFRIEQRSRRAPRPGAAYRVSDLELASRLSFFLWSSIPDDELLDAAARGTLQRTAACSSGRCGACSPIRAPKALVENFAGQWLQLRNLRDAVPDPDLFPEFDENLREAFRRETELFIESQLRDDRSVVELLTADYTFLNERLARHYGIPDVYGSRFRRVTLADEPARRAARPRQRADGHVVPEPDVAGAARQVAAREHPRHAAAAAAAGRAGAERQGRRRPAPVGARAARSSTEEPGVRELPRADGSAGLRARNFDAIGQWRDATRATRRSTRPASLPDGSRSRARRPAHASWSAAGSSSSARSPRSC